MSRPTQAIIDTAALRINIQRVSEAAPQQKIMAVVKANGYGHGAANVAHTIADKVDAFAVSCINEAIVLREEGITHPIVLLEGFFSKDELATIIHHDLHVTLHNMQQVKWLMDTKVSKPIDVWVKVDTGMHRLGFLPNEIGTIWKHLQQAEQVAKPIKIMSHLACADDRQDRKTEDQLTRFTMILNDLETEASLANSAGILGWQQTHFNWVRPGIMLYGVSPFLNSVAKMENLQPVMHFQSALIAVKQLRRGDTIGYGATWQCPQTMPVGVIAVGYADGYPRHAPSGTPVLVNGRRVPLIGRVSMDMIMVDLRTQPNARIGDPVTLWGKHLPVEEIASHAGTIAYELLTHINPRVPKILRN